MIVRRHGTFAGGIDLPDEKDATLESAIVPHRPRRLCVPLSSGGGGPVRPTVEIGAHVTAGEKIAAADSPCEPDVYAPTAGVFSRMTTASVAGRDGFAPVAAMELTDVHPPSGIVRLRDTFDWRAAAPEEIRSRIAAGRVSRCVRGGGLLAPWIDAVRRSGAGMLIANLMESQPYVTADHRLTAEWGAEVVRGLALIARGAEIDDVILAARRRHIDDYRQSVGPARMYGIERVALSHKYPAGAPPMLVKVLTGREMPPGGTTLDVGVAVIDAATCFAAYRWVACAMPPTARVVTVSGERAGRRGNFWVPFGTPCSELGGDVDEPLICGGPMVGLRCADDAVVTAGVEAVLALEPGPARPPAPCIRCGWCTDHCPARLNVAALNDAFELDLLDRAERRGAMACVECGVCSYVCPARLPLTQRVRQIKRTLTHQRSASPLFPDADAGGQS